MRKTIGIVLVTLATSFCVFMVLALSGTLDKATAVVHEVQASMSNTGEVVLKASSEKGDVEVRKLAENDYIITTHMFGKETYSMNGKELGNYSGFYAEWHLDSWSDETAREILDSL